MSTVLYLGYCRPSFWSRVFSGHIFTTLRSFLAAGMRGWHERSDPRSKKSGIDTFAWGYSGSSEARIFFC